MPPYAVLIRISLIISEKWDAQWGAIDRAFNVYTFRKMLRMNQYIPGDASGGTTMLNMRGTTLGVFVLLVAVILTYTLFVDAKGGGGGRGGRSRSRGSGGSHYYSHRRSRSRYVARSYNYGTEKESSTSTKFCPSPTLITVLPISIVSLNAVKILSSEHGLTT